MPPMKMFLKPLLVLPPRPLPGAPAVAAANLAFVRGPPTRSSRRRPTTAAARRRLPRARSRASRPTAPRPAPAEGTGRRPEMMLAPVGGGAGETLMAGWREPFLVALVAGLRSRLALRGRELGQRRLVLIDRRDRHPSRSGEGLLHRVQLRPRRRGSRLRPSGTATSTRRTRHLQSSPSPAASRPRLTRDQRSETRSGGRTGRSSSSSCWRRAAQVRPEERAFSDEPTAARA